MERSELRKIALIGAMGSGKSTLASFYAARYGVSMIDTDKAFSCRYGEISAYFDRCGEQEFRKKERGIVLEAVNSDVRIIACGGGVVTDRKSMCALRRACDIVLLTADDGVLASRIKNSDRPLKDSAYNILRQRRELYCRYADYVIDTSDGEDHVEDLHEILNAPRKNRYDVLLCDADDTILDFQTAMRYAVINAARAVGITSSDENIISDYSAIVKTVWQQLERGEITRDELDGIRFGLLRKRLKEDFDPAIMNEIYITEMQKTRFVIDGATEFLRRVRSRGIKVYIVTNGFERIAKERLKALDGEIDGAFVSEAVGYDKPDVRFFDRVYNDIGKPDKSRILIFGDSLTSDIEGGIKFGIDTCLYDRGGRKSDSSDYSVSSYAELYDIL